ncbi:MAG: Transcription initiation factor IIB [Marteilia pararefringens]
MIIANKNDPNFLMKSKNLISHKDRVMLHAFKEINNMADRLNLPKILVDRSCHFFKQAYTSNAMKGKRIDAIIAGSIYIACRCEGVPRTLKELCAVSGISKIDIGRIFKKIKLNIDSNVNSVNPDSYIERFCSNINLPRSVIKLARHICLRSMDMNLVTGRSPLSIAAVSISLAAILHTRKPFNIKKIADDCGVSDSTIKNVFKILKPDLPALVDSEYVDLKFFETLDSYFV